MPGTLLKLVRRPQASRTWRDEIEYHLGRAAQEHRMERCAATATISQSHHMLAERHEALAILANHAGTFQDAEPGSATSRKEILHMLRESYPTVP